MTNEPTKLLYSSSGDLSVGLVIPPRQPDRIGVVLRFTAVGGQPVQVEVTRNDVANLAGDLGIQLRADADKVCSWWYRLRHGDRAGLLPAAAVGCKTAQRRSSDRNGYMSGDP